MERIEGGDPCRAELVRGGAYRQIFSLCQLDPGIGVVFSVCTLYNGNMLTELPPREVRILQLRYGLLDGQVYTLEEVGRKIGVTRERVRQIEAQALNRFMTNWPIILDVLRHLWEMGKVSELKSPFYEPFEKPVNK